MKNQDLLACARGRERATNCPLGEEGKIMVELISAIGELCRRLDGKKNSKL